MNQRTIHIALSADDHYALPLAVTLFSAMKHVDPAFTIHATIVDAGMKEHQRERFENILRINRWVGQITWIRGEVERVKHLRIMRYISHAAYLRLFLGSYISKDVDRVIYLDSDLLVLSDLSRLWTMDLEGAPLMAAQGYQIHSAGAPMGIARHKELGISADSPYFNSGVMLINLDLWRAEKSYVSVLKYLEENHKFLNCHDQEGLNVIFAGRWKVLDPRWNWMSPLTREVVERLPDGKMKAELLEKMAAGEKLKPLIVHYKGADKPWVLSKPQVETFRYLHYLFSSGYLLEQERGILIDALDRN